MNEVYNQLLFYLRSLWRRRWYSITIAWLACVVGWAWVARIPDTYQSSARIYVDTDTMLGPLMAGLAVDVDVYRQVDIMQRTLLSRPNLEKVARMTDLDLTAETPAEMERLIDELQASVRISAQGGNLFRVSYESPDPELAKRVVQALLTIFVESNLGASRKDMDQARRFIDEQIRIYERQLDEAEARLAEFKRRNMGLMPGQGGYYASLQAARTQVKDVEASLREARTRRDELRQQLAQVPQFLELSSDSAAYALATGDTTEASLQARILELEQNIDSMLLRYTDRHPDVIAARNMLEGLRKQLEEHRAARTVATDKAAAEGVPAPGAERVSNPVYEKIKLDIVTAEAEVAALQNRLQRYRDRVAELESKVQTVPAVEAELQRLNRDYGIIKKNYEQLLSRRESAKIAQDLETKADKIKFRVIDPPKVPLEPSGPNRLLFLSMVLVGGLGAGIGVGFVLSQIDDSFPTAGRLKEVFAYPVLGTVSAIVSAADRRRHIFELSSFALVCLGLLGAYGGLLAVEAMAVFGST